MRKNIDEGYAEFIEEGMKNKISVKDLDFMWKWFHQNYKISSKIRSNY